MASETTGERITRVRVSQRVKGRPRSLADLARAIQMDASQLRRIETGQTAEPGIEVLDRIARRGLGLPIATIAPPEYYTEAQFEAAKQEIMKLPLPDDRKRSGIAAIDDQLRALRTRRRG